MSLEDFVFAIGDDGEWVGEAACAGGDYHDLFFSTDRRDVEAAKEICESCFVRVPCLAAALERGEEFGTWGGMSAAERTQVVKRSA